VRRLDEVPLVPTDDPTDFDWYPIQYHFGLSAFGLNAFGGDEGIVLAEEHVETNSGQEEVYLVLRGRARFAIDGSAFDVQALGLVVIRDPDVRRGAVSAEDGTVLLALGGRPGEFTSSWNPENFERLPRAG
jgi:hypothetical protein